MSDEQTNDVITNDDAGDETAADQENQGAESQADESTETGDESESQDASAESGEPDDAGDLDEDIDDEDLPHPEISCFEYTEVVLEQLGKISVGDVEPKQMTERQIKNELKRIGDPLSEVQDANEHVNEVEAQFREEVKTRERYIREARGIVRRANKKSHELLERRRQLDHVLSTGTFKGPEKK